MKVAALPCRGFNGARRRSGEGIDVREVVARVVVVICSPRGLYRRAIGADELISGMDGGWISGGANGPKAIGFEIGACAPQVPAFVRDRWVAKIPEGV